MIVKKLIALILDSLTCDLLYSGSFTSGTTSLNKSIANYKKLNVCKRAIGRNHSPNAITTNRGLCGNGYEPSHNIHIYREGILNGSAYCITPGRGCVAC